jgi:hypothetical protein
VLVRGVLMGDEDAAPKIAVSSIQSLEEVQVKLPTGCGFASIWIGRRRRCLPG